MVASDEEFGKVCEFKKYLGNRIKRMGLDEKEDGKTNVSKMIPPV